MKQHLSRIGEWLRRRIRMCIWKCWKKIKTRYKNLHNASGFYDGAGFTVLKDSIIANDSVSSMAWKEKREELLKEYTKKENGKSILLADKTFSSPSTAAIFCLGRNTNGWEIWKDKDGQTLDAVYRKQIEG